MLDKQDLQAIKELIDTSVTASEERTQAKLDAMDARMDTMDKRLDDMDKRFDDMDKRFDATDKRLDAMDARMDAMDKRFDAIDKRFDSVDAEFENMKNYLRVFFETEVMPKFQLLADGHQNLLDTLAPKARVDALEDDVIFLKSIVKSLMQQVSELKKAQ